MPWDVVAIVVSLGLLMAFAYRGYPVIVFAPIFALLAAGWSGRALLPTYTETFMGQASGYVKSFFPLFLLGAVFGKLMETTGSAGAIAESIARGLGARRAILAVVLACAILTYGGVSLFVVAFAVYPFAAALFRRADIPKRLIPGAIALGAFTFTMDALPGSPQIQNLIPARYFGTDAYAAPLVGSAGGLAIFLGGLAWLEFRRRRASASGEGYGDHPDPDPNPDPEQAGIAEATTTTTSNPSHPHAAMALAPLAVVLIANFVLSRTSWSVAHWPMHSDESLKRAFPALDLKAAVSAWALILALTMGIAVLLALNFVRRARSRSAPSSNRDPGRRSIASALTTASSGALLAIFNTASEVGFGNVIKTLPGFATIQGRLFGVSDNPLIQEAVTINVLAGVTGSASGGLSIALDTMSARFLEMAQAQGISPELLHRIASMASGGMDTLPHNGAVITLLAITGLTHRQSYADIFVITLLKTAVVFVIAAIA